MEITTQVKKTNVDLMTKAAEIHVIFSIKDYTKLDSFRDELTDFALLVQGQKKLIEKKKKDGGNSS